MRLKERYQKEIVAEMKEKFGYKNVMAVPRLEKVVVNTGFGRQVVGKSGDELKKVYEAVINDIGLICGQRPVLTKSKKSIATFKTRQGMPLGAAVVLRGKKMYDFVERVIAIALPRSRDFRGLDKKAFDEKGNLSIGIKEHIIFPEILPEKVRNIFGIEITVVTSAKNKEEGINLLKAMGFPIKK
jgi:large subunit ribosomal protein L5